MTPRLYRLSLTKPRIFIESLVPGPDGVRPRWCCATYAPGHENRRLWRPAYGYTPELAYTEWRRSWGKR